MQKIRFSPSFKFAVTTGTKYKTGTLGGNTYEIVQRNVANQKKIKESEKQKEKFNTH